MFCGNCGAQQEPGTRFCGACGAAMSSSNPSTPTVSTTPGSPPGAAASHVPTTAGRLPGSTPSSQATGASAAGATPASPAQPGPAPSGSAPSSAPQSSAPQSGSAPASRSVGAAPWAASSSPTQARATKPRKSLPLVPLVAAGAALAIAVGGGAAWFMMRGSDSQAGASLNPTLLSQQGAAPTQAPTKAWSLSNDDILRGAGVDSTSSSTATLLDYGNNGMLLMSVPNTAVVAVKETGSVAWQVKGTFDQCQPLVNKGGWACIYAPPTDDSNGSSSTQTNARQLVTLDNNGRVSKIKDLDGGESLYQEKTGTVWLLDGIGGSANEDAGPGSNQTTSVSVTRLDDSGKAQWTYAHNLTLSYGTLGARGQASAPLFTLDGVTYIANAQDSDGHGVALDASGKQTDKLKSAALANDRGRPITQVKDRYVDGGATMKKETATVASPTLSDTGSLPLYSMTGTTLQKLNGSGTDVDWEAGAPDAAPLAYCGSTTVATNSQNMAWFLDKDGKEPTSKQLPGVPQFCWGGKQLVSFDADSSTVVSNTLADGGQAWKLDLSPDDQSSSRVTGITYSPTTNGFIAYGDGIAYYGPKS